MEKREIENLQRTTKIYSASAMWLDTLVTGIIFSIIGLVTYFSFNWYIILFLILVDIGWSFLHKRLKRNMMSKEIGYVKHPLETPLLKRKSFVKGILLGIPLGVIVFLAAIMLKVKDWDAGIGYPAAFLCVGLLIILTGIIYRKGIIYYGIFYYGLYFIVCSIILMFPLRHLFYAHAMAPVGIMLTLGGGGGILLGINDYFQYRKIIRRIKNI